MNHLIAQEKQIIENNAVIAEEDSGTASELMQLKLTTLSDPVRSRIQHLSVLEVIA